MIRADVRPFEELPVPVVVLSVRGDRISHLNRSAIQNLGWRRGQDVGDLMHLLEGDDLCTWLQDLRTRRGAVSSTRLAERQSDTGTRQRLHLTAARHRTRVGARVTLWLVDWSAVEDRAWALAVGRLDALTGLLNRSAFMERLAADRDAVIAFFDLDGFKQVNDQHGHVEGDRVLQAVADHLRTAFPEPATVARLGGDEFVVLVPGGDTAAVAERCRALVQIDVGPAQPGGPSHVLTTSVGVGSARGVPAEIALARADAAMYAAKYAGRASVQDYATPTTVGRSRGQVFADMHRLEEQVRTDPLTGLPNVRAMWDALQQAQGQADRSGTPFSIAFVDIDHFGAYNHAHSDIAGDQALVAVGRQLAASCRASDQVFRKGGEELVVLLPATGRDDALAAAERLRTGVQDLGIPHDAAPSWGVLTVTAGVATSQEGEQAEHVLDRAGRAAMAGKNSGQRNAVLPAPD